MNITHSIVKNTAILSVGQLTSKPLFVIYVAALARYVGTEGIGQITTAQALCAMAFVFVNLGLDTLVIRDVAADRNQAALYMAAANWIKLILGVGAIIVLSLVALAGYSPETQVIILMYAFLNLLGAIYGTIRAVYQAHERMEYDIALQLGRDLLNIGLSLLAIYLSARLVVIVGISLLATAVQLVIGWVLLLRLKVPLLVKLRATEVKKIFKLALPFSAFVFIAVAGSNVTTIILSVTVSQREVGLYGAAQAIFATLVIFPSMFSTAVFPVFSRLSAEFPIKLSAAFGKSFELMLVVGFPMAALSVLMARQMVELLYGTDFIGAAPVLQVLALVLAGMTGFACGSYLNASGRQIFYTVSMGIFITVQIVLSLVLIPYFGILGAAVSFMLHALLGFAFYTLSCYHFAKLPLPWTLLAKVLLATTIVTLGTGFILGLGLHFIPAGLLATLVYGVLLLLFKVIPKEEWVILWRALFPRWVSRTRTD